MYQRHKVGKNGEYIAKKYLEKLNYKILKLNFLCKRGEIDIIAIDKLELVFIEVKTRSNIFYGSPAEAVTIEKQKHMYKAAKYYIYINNLENRFIRFDVIEIYLSKNKIKINHIKNINK